MRGLAGVLAQRGQFAVEGVGDVDPSVRATGGAGSHYPDVVDGPGLKAFVGEELDVGERVARVGVDGGERGLAGGPVVGVGGGDPFPVDLGALHHEALRADLADHPADIATEIVAGHQLPVGVAEEENVLDPDLLRGRALFGLSDAPDLGPGDCGIEAASVTIGADAVAHLDARGCPGGDCAGPPEVDVIGVRHDDERPLDQFWCHTAILHEGRLGRRGSVVVTRRNHMRQLDPSELYELDPDRPDLEGPVLVQALEGFVDAGGARALTAQHLLETLPHRVLARFDVDQLFDYRARRPLMVFAKDHWESYEAPELALHLLHDEGGKPFLLLAGPEPDVQWERFVEAVRQLCTLLGVRRSIGLNAIPMGLPHTRPVGVIAHGSPRELVKDYQPWIETVHVPASAGHLLEFRLGEAGFEAMGFAVHVPHYVAQSPYPAAAAQLVREIAKSGELQLPVDALDQAAAVTRQSLDEQVAGAPEVAEVVLALEQQYDAFVEGQGRSLMAESELPTADELGAELERFLRELPRPE